MNLVKRIFCCLLFWGTQAFAFGVSIQNIDPHALFCVWAVPEQEEPTAQSVLPLLPLVSRGPTLISPGESALVSLAPKQMLLGAFLPWDQKPTYLTILHGDILRRADLPPQGTLQINQDLWQRVHPDHRLDAALQAWGFDPPPLVLDGLDADWNEVKPLLTWGSAYSIKNSSFPWAKGFPFRSLKVKATSEGLWIDLRWDQDLPQGWQISLGLKRSTGLIEWPLTTTEGTIWLWRPEASAMALGRSVRGGHNYEAWIHWNRLAPEEEQSWKTDVSSWVLLVSHNGIVQTEVLAAFTWADLP